jgi:hypothetical protein
VKNHPKNKQPKRLIIKIPSGNPFDSEGMKIPSSYRKIVPINPPTTSAIIFICNFLSSKNKLLPAQKNW